MRDMIIGLIVVLGIAAVITPFGFTIPDSRISPSSGNCTDYELIEMNVSAYCPCEKCCGEWADGITASGVKAEGRLIAAPSDYPFGTVMEVPGYGRATVQDRGGAIKGNKIDLLFSTHQEALEWGRQHLTVKVF